MFGDKRHGSKYRQFEIIVSLAPTSRCLVPVPGSLLLNVGLGPRVRLDIHLDLSPQNIVIKITFNSFLVLTALAKLSDSTFWSGTDQKVGLSRLLGHRIFIANNHCYK